MTRKLYCSQCQIMAINNVACHELGCPNAKLYPKGNEVPPWRKRPPQRSTKPIPRGIVPQ